MIKLYRVSAEVTAVLLVNASNDDDASKKAENMIEVLYDRLQGIKDLDDVPEWTVEIQDVEEDEE